MFHELHVDLGFLCALVPHRRSFHDPSGAGPKRVTVLLRDLRGPHLPAIFRGSPGVVPEVHIAHLRLPHAFIDAASPCWPLPERTGGERLGADFSAYDFNCEEILFRPDGEDLERQDDALVANVTPLPASGSGPGNDDEQRSLRWIAEFSRFAGIEGRVKRDLIYGSGPHDPVLAARVILNKGHLEVPNDEDDLTRTDTVWRAQGEPNERSQQLALKARLQLPFESYVDVVFRPFDDQQPARMLRLRPTNPAELILPITVQNSESEARRKGDTRIVPFDERDSDFEHFYDLMQQPADQVRLPAFGHPPPGSSGGHKACSPTCPGETSP